MTRTLDELVRLLAKGIADQVLVELRRGMWTVEEWIPVARSPLGKMATLARERASESSKVRRVFVKRSSVDAYLTAHSRAVQDEEDLFG